MYPHDSAGEIDFPKIEVKGKTNKSEVKVYIVKRSDIERFNIAIE